MPETEPADDRGAGAARQARYLGVAYDFMGVVVGAGLLGWFIDSRLGSAPWGVMLGSLLGLVGGLVRLVRTTTRLQALDGRPR